MSDATDRSLLARWIGVCLDQRLVVVVAVGVALVAGLIASPLGDAPFGLPHHPVPVDALPDLGENQQIVYTEWPGHSPQDVDDQITYPLTVALLGIAGVKDVRSQSMFGTSTIYVVFEDDVEFYWSRSRVLEKLNALPSGTLPDGAQPTLGPDATALGQIFWYTLEGRDPSGRPVGGWDLHELRTIQDFTVKYQLASVAGVSEVASIGGFVREIQVEVDPDALRAADVGLDAVVNAVRRSNVDVGARTLEINRVEYVVRGVGRLESTEDLENTAIAARDGQPILLRDVARVSYGPGLRRGVLTKAGVERVGGVVVARTGENPMATIQRVKKRIATVAPGLPTRVLEDGTTSQVTIVPFYDRSGLIDETLGTLDAAIRQQILITVLIVVLLVGRIGASLVVSAMLPMAVLLTFVGMRTFGVDANVVALSGIAIAIGTIVDVGIVLVENVSRALDEAPAPAPRRPIVRAAIAEVGGALLTAIATTVVSFLPVFALESTEGKLFHPLAATKTFALVAAILLALTIVPVVAERVIRGRTRKSRRHRLRQVVAIVVGFVALVGVWSPLGPGLGVLANGVFVALLVASVFGASWAVRRVFPDVLAWALEHKAIALSPVVLVVALGSIAWLGFDRVGGWLPTWTGRDAIARAFPGLGSEFMPALDEGSFLYMPTTMPHASIGEAADILAELDRRILSVPEVKSAVGKIGRVESALDPAPISMVETIIEYAPEYARDAEGRWIRQWRDSIRSPQDVWDAIVAAAAMPGVTSAPKLQPIETRVVMLQSGFRAPLGIKVFGPDLETIESFALELERRLETVESIAPATVFADRVVGKPYLEIDVDRERIARYGLSVADVQEVVGVAVGGRVLTTTLEGRARHDVRVRYPRAWRGSPEALADVLVPTSQGAQIPLGELASIDYRRGPQVIKSEDTFLVAYVLFDKRSGHSEVGVVEDARRALEEAIARGELVVPAGVSFEFAGSYENQVRANARLRVILPLVLVTIFSILYLQFRRTSTALIVFASIFVAWSGGFLLLWFYGQDWFLRAGFGDFDLRDVFGVRPVDLSVAVWVGFLALFGIATDDGVLMATRIRQSLRERRPREVAELRAAVVEGGRLRIRAAVTTTATTVLALVPILTSSGRGADVMTPMAIPALGGMIVAGLTWFVVPILTCWREERRRAWERDETSSTLDVPPAAKGM